MKLSTVVSPDVPRTQSNGDYMTNILGIKPNAPITVPAVKRKREILERTRVIARESKPVS